VNICSGREGMVRFQRMQRPSAWFISDLDVGRSVEAGGGLGVRDGTAVDPAVEVVVVVVPSEDASVVLVVVCVWVVGMW